MFAYRSNSSPKEEFTLWKYFLIAVVLLLSMILIMMAVKKDPNAPIILSDSEISKIMHRTSDEKPLIIPEKELQAIMAQTSPPKSGTLILSDAEITAIMSQKRNIPTN